MDKRRRQASATINRMRSHLKRQAAALTAQLIRTAGALNRTTAELSAEATNSKGRRAALLTWLSFLAGAVFSLAVCTLLPK